MDCKTASVLMMRYMDSVITESEAKTLNSHIIGCSVCKEDFMLYEYMAGEFEKQVEIFFEPPADFEMRVMKSICVIKPDYCRVYSQDTVVGFVFGAFSMFFGAGVIISMYKVEIMETFSKYPYIGEIMESAGRASDTAFAFMGELGTRASYFSEIALALIESAKYGILFIVAALIAVQLVFYSKSKVEV